MVSVSSFQIHSDLFASDDQVWYVSEIHLYTGGVPMNLYPYIQTDTGEQIFCSPVFYFLGLCLLDQSCKSTDQYNCAKHNAVPAKYFKIMFLNITHQEFDHNK